MRRFALLLLFFGVCANSYAATLNIMSVDSRADVPLGVSISGMRPTEVVELRLAMQDSKGTSWRSNAVYRADLEGRVDPSMTAAEAGSYTGIDQTGLFWSMKPDGPGRASPFPTKRKDGDLRFAPAEFTLEMVIDGKVAKTTKLRRWIDGEGISASTRRPPALSSGLV
ncbi:acyl-CoA thioesterase/BAAT N-terminal domain-containing protein [Xanthomonas campestris]|uniref:acyl-CoA thioesterase/BAAT N-terminal domain-containing protein n=1 Tax=Xanthomonas campestris TaxID=339 RepID=UPI00096FA231|nr:acyl-CoA thioesterase/BAAT N-terminal domain-containing protein [Xanthomonas campestris]WVL59164.1 acyl-CoA thioesterase/BAAT N-terminal domain-containing protein [Xanthomonas campestris pv. barbareae]